MEKNVLVFVNGFYRADISTITSQEGVIACALSEAKEKHADLFNAYFSKCLPTDEIFANINTAFHQDGAFIHFAKKQKAEHPIHILNLVEGDQIISNPRNLIIGEAFSEGKVVTSYHNLNGGKSFTNAVNECFAAENSYLEFNKLQEEDGSSFHIATDQVQQEKSGNFTINTFTFNW